MLTGDGLTRGAHLEPQGGGERGAQEQQEQQGYQC